MVARLAFARHQLKRTAGQQRADFRVIEREFRAVHLNACAVTQQIHDAWIDRQLAGDGAARIEIKFGERTYLKPLIHQRRGVLFEPLTTGQIKLHQHAALAVGEIFIQAEGVVLVGMCGIRGRVKGDSPVDQRRQALQLHFGTAQPNVGFHAGDVPEAAAFFHQIGETPLNDNVDGDALFIGVNRVVIHPANRDFAVIDQRAAVQRTKIRGVQMDHQLAGIEAVFRLCIKRPKVVARLAFARHHADIVTAHQRVQPGNARQRGFRRDEPELRLVAQGVFHVILDTDRHLDFIQIFAQANILYGADFDALIAHRRAPGDDPVGRHKVDSDGGASLFIRGPDKPARYQQCDNGQDPERRDATFCFNSRFSL